MQEEYYNGELTGGGYELDIKPITYRRPYVKVTVDIYGHLAPEGNKEAVDFVDDDAHGRNLYATKW